MNLLSRALDALTDAEYHRAVQKQLRGLRAEAAAQRRVQLLEQFDEHLTNVGERERFNTHGEPVRGLAA